MKTKGTGKFGSRYGKKLRESAKAVEKKSSRIYECPSCSRKSVKKIATGLWECRKCKTKYASKAFEFKG